MLEKRGVSELRYFETRSDPVIRKMPILIAKTIIDDLVDRIRAPEHYGLFTDKVTEISNIC